MPEVRGMHVLLSKSNAFLIRERRDTAKCAAKASKGNTESENRMYSCVQQEKTTAFLKAVTDLFVEAERPPCQCKGNVRGNGQRLTIIE